MGVAGFECHLVNEHIVIPFPPVSTGKVRGQRGFDQLCWLQKPVPLARLLWLVKHRLGALAAGMMSAEGARSSPRAPGEHSAELLATTFSDEEGGRENPGHIPIPEGQATVFLHGASDAGGMVPSWQKEMCPPT